MKLKKRIISFFLILALWVGGTPTWHLAPVSAFAETLPDTPESWATTLETGGSVVIPTEETEGPDGAEESPAVPPAEPPVSEVETAEEGGRFPHRPPGDRWSCPQFHICSST